MTRTEILELSNQFSERKAEKIGNLMPNFYRFVLQDICRRYRFWWRRVSAQFTLVVGSKTYNLSSITTVPAGALTNIAFDEITKITIILAPNPLQVAELTPVFTPEGLIEMMQNTSVVAPARYTMQGSDYKTLLIDPPDQAYTAYIVGWGMPNPPTDDASDVVPLIPPWGHNVIVAGIVWRVFKYAYGSKNGKTIDAMAEYEQGIQDLQMRKQFDPNYSVQMSLNEDAIRST